MDVIEALSRIPLFSGLDRKDLERLSRSFRERTFATGHDVTTEGETGIGFFVILDGTADVSVHGEKRATLGPGAAFGEMSLIDSGPRSATVTATSDLRCVALSAWEFRPFLEEHPQVAWTLLEALAKRVRALEG